MKDNDYKIMLSDDNIYHVQKWYICTRYPLFGMSGAFTPGRAASTIPNVINKVLPPEVGNYYYVIDDNIPGNTRNEGFRTKEDAKIALLIYIT